jgi:hypothetical protein
MSFCDVGEEKKAICILIDPEEIVTRFDKTDENDIHVFDEIDSLEDRYGIREVIK